MSLPNSIDAFLTHQAWDPPPDLGGISDPEALSFSNLFAHEMSYFHPGLASNGWQHGQQQQQQQKQQEKPTEDQGVPAKKKRGRPRKIPAATNEAAIKTPAEGKNAPPVSKPRGRAAKTARKSKAKSKPPSGAVSAPRPPKKLTRRSGQAGDTTLADNKKQRCRDRNRDAALRCRSRQKRGVEHLQEKEAAAEAVNIALSAEAATLRSQVLTLKGMLLRHSGCGCSFIDCYLLNNAHSISQDLSQASAGAHSPASALEGSTLTASRVPRTEGSESIDPWFGADWDGPDEYGQDNSGGRSI